MAFDTFDLGKVLLTAEAIKGQRQQSQTDMLRQRYLGQQAQNQQTTFDQGQQDRATELEAKDARTSMLEALALQNSEDPVGDAAFVSPNLVKHYEQARGAGSFAKATPDEIKALARRATLAAAAKAGVQLPQRMQEMTRADGSVVQMNPATGEKKLAVAALQRDPNQMTDYQRQRLEIDRSKASATGADQNKPPAGYRWKADGSLEAIPGGPAVKGSDDPTASESQKLDAANNTLSAIRDVKNMIGLNTAGVGGQAMRMFSGTEATDMAANIDTIKANVGFDRLQMMRDASKTGGALGGIAVQELNMLQSTIASLDPKQSPSQLRANIEKVEKQYERSVKAYERAIGKRQGGADANWGEGGPQKGQTYNHPSGAKITIK